MPSSAVHTFTDPDDYAALIPATKGGLTVIGRGHFTARLTRIDLHRRGCSGSSTTAAGRSLGSIAGRAYCHIPH